MDDERIEDLTRKMFDKDYVLDHIRVGMQKKSDDEYILKRPCKFEDIETYLFVRHDRNENGTFTVTTMLRDILKIIEMTEEEAWETAWENVESEICIRPLHEELMDLAKMENIEVPDSFVKEILDPLPGLYVVTNSERFKGAASILVEDVMKMHSEVNGISRWVACPSSVHEFLLFPLFLPNDLQEFSQMVMEINKTDVRPEDQLADKAYVMEWGDDDDGYDESDSGPAE